MTAAPEHLADAQHPWIGLASFTEGDCKFFAGRGDEIDELLRLVRRDTLTLLYGVSGLGKTSLLQAGIFPALRTEDFLPVPIRLDYLEGAPPLAVQVRGALSAAASAAGVEVPARRAGETLWEYFHREENHFWSPRNDLITPFLVFDQFEEAFTLGRENPDRARRAAEFIAELADLVENRPPAALRDDPQRAREFSFKPAPLKVLLAMREDYFAELDRIRGQFRALGQNRLRLLHMSTRQARQVIDLGAPLLAPGVAERIVAFVAGEAAGADAEETAVAPALLSLVLHEFNERRLALGPEAKITPDLLDVEQQKILEDFYVRTLQDFPVGVRNFIEDELLTATGYRNSCALDDALRSPDVTQPILDELVNRRLLAYEDRHHARRVEITHDVLAPVIKISRDTRLTREALAKAERQKIEAREKERAARRRTGILSVLLALALGTAAFGWYERSQAEKGRLEAKKQTLKAEKQTLEAEKLARLARDKSIEAAEQKKQAEASAARAEDLRQKADNQARLALSRQLAGLANNALNKNALQRAAFFAAAGYQTAPSYETQQSLEGAIREQPELRTHLSRHRDSVWSVAFSPDGKTLASASNDQTVILWDVASGKPVGEPLAGDGAAIWHVAFSPDGKILAAASDNNTVILWDVASRKPLGKPLAGHSANVRSVAFSRDSKTLASASEDQTVILWDVASHRALGQPLAGHKGVVWSVAFSPDGKTLASANWDKTVILWDVASRKPLGQPLQGHQDQVVSLDFSPDGRTLASGSGDKNVILWDVATRKPRGDPPIGHDKVVNGAAFSPDCRMLASASEDHTVILWDVASHRALGQPLAGHTAAVTSVAFSPDGKTLASASWDKTVMLWDVASRKPLGKPLQGHRGYVWGLAFSPDGKTLASASTDGTVRLWDVNGQKALGEPLQAHQGEAYGVAFSPNGETLASAHFTGAVILWDVASRQPRGDPLLSRAGQALSVAFSPDGQTLASGHTTKAVILWDVASGKPRGEPLTDHNQQVKALAFSPDGQTLASGSRDDTVILWDVASCQRLHAPLQGHSATVASVAFSPDGRTMFSASFDQSAKLYDWRLGVAFNLHDEKLPAPSFDESVILWDLDVNALVSKASTRANRNLTRREWAKYVGADVPYQATFPELPVPED